MPDSSPTDRTFYVIVRNEDDNHWTSHNDFYAGKFFRDRASALAALPASPLSSSTSTTNAPSLSDSGIRPTPNARTSSTSSTASRVSEKGVRYEVRKIAARSLCGTWTWWFVDGDAAVGGNDTANS